MPAWSTGCASARPAPYCSCRRLTLLRLTGRTGCAHASRRPSAISKVFLAVIDLNADLGEGVGTDGDLLPYITSVNVACGAHAGDLETIRRTVELARTHGVGIGAHPSFPDREGFGRRAMALRAGDVVATVAAQIEVVAGVARDAGVRLQHVKPHGALYNQAVADHALAAAIGDAVRRGGRALIVVALAGSPLVTVLLELGGRVAQEAVIDRGYSSRGTLMPRSPPRALTGRAEGGPVAAGPAERRWGISLGVDPRPAIRDHGDRHGDAVDARPPAPAIVVCRAGHWVSAHGAAAGWGLGGKPRGAAVRSTGAGPPWSSSRPHVLHGTRRFMDGPAARLAPRCGDAGGDMPSRLTGWGLAGRGACAGDGAGRGGVVDGRWSLLGGYVRGTRGAAAPGARCVDGRPSGRLAPCPVPSGPPGRRSVRGRSPGSAPRAPAP